MNYNEIQATKSQHIQQHIDKYGGVAVIDCYSTQCDLSRRVYPYAQQKNQETLIPLITVNIDQAPELITTYNIQVTPTFILIHKQWNNIVQKISEPHFKNIGSLFQQAQQLRYS